MEMLLSSSSQWGHITNVLSTQVGVVLSVGQISPGVPCECKLSGERKDPMAVASYFPRNC